ncbi:metal ABC transporter substrate-binding protein [Sulfuriflexus sp.]|uniref:metal ABC transporter substrate-binding protein n=1 Tax=Sulfuriflexus sp. TaxID=2015443 RepID=UPI0028CEAE10|nr:zinc ABC transporter substrate-binding protein [Sulfuriflexus sp.]MDT8405051.1 zinc ABC transporter substrate-binding protein [Sulfuriflexus sp.]
MKHLLITLVFVLTAVSEAHAEIRILACEPEWAALSEELAGDKATIHSATTGLQDPHRITARPSLIAKMRQADLVICSGADLEVGWLPLLLRKSGNPKVQPGRPGYLEAASHVRMREIPRNIDRSEGDVHSQGNPHIHTDPRNIARLAPVISARLASIDPEHAAYYRQRLADFKQRWDRAISRWEAEAKNLRGLPVVTQHKSWVYLIEWLGLERLAVLEEKPGILPGAGHLAGIARQLEQKPAKLILRAAYQSPRASEWLSERSGIPAAALPFTVGGNENAKDLFGLFDETLRILNQYAHAQ